jgi:phosphoglycerol geranylgeranyltransferase
MAFGRVERYIRRKIDSDGAMLFTLIDPDSQPFEKGAKLAEIAYEAGTDAILVGGSIGAQGMILDKTTKLIAEKVDVPVILFPGSVGNVTHYADAIYFMYLLNSRDVYWVSTAQIQGAPVVKRLGLEPIPTVYIVIEPGRAVGWISNANLIPRDRPDLAAATALAGEYMGARVVITDSGSGAPTPASVEMIAAIKSQLSIPYFYGGGCKTPEQATQIIKAGADGIQIGTAFEKEGDYQKAREKVRKMVKAVKDAGKERIKHPPKSRSLVRSIKFPNLRFRIRKSWEFLGKKMSKKKNGNNKKRNGNNNKNNKHKNNDKPKQEKTENK